MVSQNGFDTVLALMDAVDNWIELPARDVDKPFLMPVEDVFTITGRGTVAAGHYRNWSCLIQVMLLKSLVWELTN